MSVHTRRTSVGSSGVDTPIVVYLGDENLISVPVHANIYVAATELLRVRHAICLHPTDRPWVTDQDFILA